MRQPQDLVIVQVVYKWMPLTGNDIHVPPRLFRNIYYCGI